MACNKCFAKNYMLLDPQKLGFHDAISLLFSSNLKKRKFLDTSETREHSFEHRFLIFLTIIGQKLLLLVATPLAWLGFCFETFLNIYSNNGGFMGIFLNTLTFRLKIPDRSSPNYLSCISHVDGRVKLDEKIKPGDVNYFGAITMMASKIVYENEAYIKNVVNDVWKMEFLGFYSFWNDYLEKYTTQAFMMRDKLPEHDTIVVSFRGTEPFNSYDWISDLDLSWYEFEGVGRAHGGNMKALGMQKNLGWPKELENRDKRYPLAYYTIRNKLRELVKEDNRTKFIITGHSLGGALATVFPAVLAFHDEKLLLERLEGIYTFGQPRVGDTKFGEFMIKTMRQYGIRYYRFVYGFDMVPRLPLDGKALMFKHFGPCIYFDGNYVAQVLEEEPFKNYFSFLGAILMRINACMEIVKSFTIGWAKGKDYEECNLFRMVRLFGLLMPGIPAHCPQDYVNSTRLGSKSIFSPPIKESLQNEYDIKLK